MAAIAKVLLSILIAAPAAGGRNVAVVLSQDYKPYSDALSGVGETCEANFNVFVMGSGERTDEKILAEVMTGKFDLLMAVGKSALGLLVGANPRSPVVFTMVLNPCSVTSGSAVHVAGSSLNVEAGRYVDVLAKISPKSRRLGLVYNPKEAGDVEAQAAPSAAEHDLKLVAKEVSSKEDAVTQYLAMQDEIDAFWLVPDSSVFSDPLLRKALLDQFKERKPLIGAGAKQVKLGALFGFDFDSEDVGRQAGEMADGLLRGQPAADMGMQPVRSPVLVINAKAADALGVDLGRLKGGVRIVGR